MCGIVAIVTQHSADLPERLNSAVERLAHRGPDDRGIWLSPGRHAGLGHTRLSIIDVETGHQPIANEEGSVAICANGEFYGYERMRDALRARGHTLTTRSDSEVALHLYEELGAESVSLLRGEFAYVIWDGRNDVLFAARDRFGIKPLFYALCRGGIVVASEIKAILASGVAAAWDRDALFQSFHFVLHQDRSLFDGIRQVPPGHFLKFSRGRLTIRRYWDADFPNRLWRRSPAHASGHDRASGAQMIEETGRRLEEAVAIRMRADVPIACYLSGGVDSSGVLGIANLRLGHRIGAFTVCFDHPDFDEGEIAREMAAAAFSQYHPIRVTNAGFADVFVDSVAAGEGVQLNGHGPARYILSREVRRAGYKVVLGGEGADELFLGYHFAERALRFSTDDRAGRRILRRLSSLFGMFRAGNEAQRYVRQVSPLMGLLSRFIGFPDELLNNLVPRFRELRNVISPEFLQHRRGDPYREFLRQFDWRGQLFGREPVRQLLYLWLKSSFPNYVLAGERLDMAHAVELRLPFLDHQLFEFVREIPAASLFRQEQNKHLLRRTVRPYVTDRVYAGAKRPFFAPPSTLYEGNPLTELIFDLIRSPHFRDLPFFVPSAVDRLLQSLRTMTPDMRASMDPVLFMLASLAVLQRRYGISSTSSI